MDANPLVSVVIPVFNGERYLRESLDSIVAQTYSNVEFLLMDDASTDGSPEILREYGAVDVRMQVHRAPANRGIFGNINDGVSRARGEFVAIHHADDLYDARILEREIEVLRARPDVGVVFCADVFIDEEGREFGRLALPREIASAPVLDYRLVLNGFLRHQNTFIRGGSGLFRKAVLDEIGPFDISYDLRADLDMWLRLARRAPIAILDEHLVAYRFGHENSSRRYARLRTEPEIFFTIIDRELTDGGRNVAEPEALAAYDGHRGEDILLVAINNYIVGRLREARVFVSTVDPHWFARTRRVDRIRLLVLLLLVHVLVRLPRIPPVAALFYRRWHGRGLERTRKRRARRAARRSPAGAAPA